MVQKIIVALLAAWLAGCAAVKVEDYAAEKPVLDLATYFNGTLDANGMFQDRAGKVIKRFHVVIEASWNGKVGTLDEDFTYSDGVKQRRVWTITKLDAHRYKGTADDVVGEADGVAYGNALRWRYVLALPVDGKTYHVDFDDWMFLIDDKVMLNRSYMSKFGFRLGEVTLSFTKR
ncbi:MAG: DUF3833 domain-containing protein [Sterolibacteriaceae bacterium]|uniref:DUF3833 domain-containing protein n=1 Tax=Candidatus Methylophosphatis roskildensis TaxID=2899263 RepID=A0A9D7E7A2_9PROT|nr:DUF3833 domain-containing protein [Candidatus Methylophosphatis roskildensis]MBK7235565.1 DUF3833 domain-containing protein [Sterolibacteriaceae bacterium]MBK7663288.1 DUF3833 domain-containing protein [Sterolibacteriaceae bacterium]MBK9087397.1 DUF3833 domain-containing protein [Sterolibacteriaceae bacterium]